MRFALEIRSGRRSAGEFAELLSEQIRRYGAEVLGDEDARPDLVLAVGGDGTMLSAVRRSLLWDVPVLGFNLGTVGFLTEGDPAEVETVVKSLVAGDYRIHERMTIAAAVAGTIAMGVNDVVVEKVDSTRLVGLAVSIDEVEFNTYRADGLIVSTPTGSTAYTFSVGGPLVDTKLEALVMTPVASHSLFDRSLVLPADSVISVTVIRDRPVKITVDKSDLGQAGEGETITIRRGDHPARFVTFGQRSFAGLIKDKFGLPGSALPGD